MKHNPPVFLVTSAADAEELLRLLGVTRLAVIQPQPDLVYGHTFKWPAEIDRLNGNPEPESIKHLARSQP